MVSDNFLTMQYADMAGAAAGAYVAAMFAGGGASAINAIAGGAGQYLGNAYPIMKGKEEAKTTATT